jgi:hypothetical protein
MLFVRVDDSWRVRDERESAQAKLRPCDGRIVEADALRALFRDAPRHAFARTRLGSLVYRLAEGCGQDFFAASQIALFREEGFL